MTTSLAGRTTIYNGITMRSRNEARFAAELDAHAFQWTYELECYASGRVQYLPDFAVETTDGTVFVEVKPERPAMRPLFDRMRAIRGSLPDALLAVTCPAWRNCVVLDMPGQVQAAAWARWEKGGVRHHGLFCLGEIAPGEVLLPQGRVDLLHGDWVCFLPFSWDWQETG